MIRAALALLLLASPADAQRIGVGLLNMGPLTRETANHVRSGNMGVDYAFRVEHGDRWTVGMTYAPTHLYVWPHQPGEDLSRWSFRPTADARSYGFAWLSVDAGYRIPLFSAVSVEPGIAAWVPTATDHQSWGAQMGWAPAATLELRVHHGRLALACRGSALYQRPHTWVVLTRWSGGPDAPLDTFWSYPVSCGIEVG